VEGYIKMTIKEPQIIKGKYPEKSLHDALVKSIRDKSEQLDKEIIIFEEFGLDISIFFKENQHLEFRFIEVKTFVGSRPGGVGVGSSKGNGSQIDLLELLPNELEIFEKNILWVMGFGTLPEGSPRYKCLSSNDVQVTAMGGIRRGKQNNLRVSEWQNGLIEWGSLLDEVFEFLFGK